MILQAEEADDEQEVRSWKEPPVIEPFLLF